ncbi:MAG: RsmE family RNA methyltransferase [Candidatus Omnitrophota bacterium]|nr:16S rRNA (uracil(1498)-N(3))-methyltransferase [Candidatus Omnitrophota bacterium]MBU1928538.1 16S rRNA (uracil(1498)-N(3))-methyltransferase [Candidatus Omnitrophota bacterium]MBU2035001.1 16S rRNA (uracil(1498)-N(3))-methyltransferase [Candidatus Omnitrophota bacterium]MBU2221460.1 16S rRNA (uracil(1498)-N(3))-methyltransferase [Candidatus Omnitrophota bacterium]MBU2258031.1 16S rRNA (uracil(1498)-N(3))-methyltransferase [Candidatus Omnitrophota bacterium]
MFRIYCLSGDISGDEITFTDTQQIHHLRDVLRIKSDEEIIVCDEKGDEYITAIDSFKSAKMVLRIKKRSGFVTDNKPKITVACAIPKRSNMDEIIDKLTQLGVYRIIPLQTERVIVRIGQDKKISRQKRWSKIALNASQQSQRKILPVVDPVRDIKELLAELDEFDLRLIPTLEGERITIKEILKKGKPESIIVFIGPEGDFTPEEVEMAKKALCIPVTLGDLVLRVETAAIAVAGFLRFYEEA